MGEDISGKLGFESRLVIQLQEQILAVLISGYLVTNTIVEIFHVPSHGLKITGYNKASVLWSYAFSLLYPDLTK